eukprot:CAMPEP_0184658652 /NCGR_PEP_ID=MMETSP0308-20130426/26365_1 /TAXON_ID=38269 /ORGANISM="Gloeochaete witrockiana, Strain SAG 46.84" /LENGTH=291 /DNA_ID=CAMNT_0027097803 /DNA_START=263 /DNA_END=1138 /DNA_ORIENTATION=+
MKKTSSATTSNYQEVMTRLETLSSSMSKKGEVEVVEKTNQCDLTLHKDALTYGGERIIELDAGKKILLDDINYGWYRFYNDNGLYWKTKWLGAQFLQPPIDLLILQEIVWEVKPDLIIEVGAHAGGSALFLAHIMDAYNKDGKIVTFDPYDFYTRKEIEYCDGCKKANETTDFWQKHVTFYQADADLPESIEKVKPFVSNAKVILVNIDADHTREGIEKNIKNYHDFVTPGSYMIVQDTHLSRYFHWPEGYYAPPVITEFIKEHGDSWMVDREREYLGITAHPSGYIKRIK